MSQPVRLGLFYAALFVGTGASSPYIPVWFASRGLSGAEIGLILSAPMFARAVKAVADKQGGGDVAAEAQADEAQAEPA